MPLISRISMIALTALTVIASSLSFTERLRRERERLPAGNLTGLSEPEQLMLLYLSKVNSESFKTTREDVQRLRELGWTDEQIAEAIHVAAMMGLCNRVANAFGLASQNFLDLQLPR